jgi:DNA-binding MarR family transcriptional regulator
VKRQITSEDGRLRLTIGPRRAALFLEGKKIVGFDVVELDDLTSATARDLSAPGTDDLLVVYRRSSPEGRTILRKRGVSFVGADAEVYLHQPPIHVELPARRPAQAPPLERSAPFATRVGRISRWLLLNSAAEPTFRQLAQVTELSESAVSRTAAVLAEERLIEVEVNRRDLRVRRVHVRDSAALLDAFERGSRRRIRSSTWDIGARDFDRALERVRNAAKRGGLGYAIGGLAGASLARFAVDPTDVDVWIDRADYNSWTDELTPIPARRGPGRVTLRLLPDPYVLSLATRNRDIFVADPVQLYFDCYRSGERALETANAIRSEMDW